LTRPRIALLVTGDEQLSGKRQDKHLAKVIELLKARGMSLSRAAYVGDDEDDIAAAIAESLRRGEVLLCSGGIGATPDDRTRQAAARAFGVPIARHPQGEALILAEYGERARPHRVLMADFPQGAALIPNPVNRVAGFSVGTCYFVPGFPEMAWPMLEWVLDECLGDLHQSDTRVEYALRVVGTSGEGDLLPLMEDVLARFPDTTLSSLPFRGDGNRPRHIEFGFRGPAVAAAAAYRHFEAAARVMPGTTIESLRPPAD
jgi:molybdopterin-biosynthesis enzyme MoeA-like protein